MRIDEDKIFGAYVGSLIEESKKGGKLPPWLKSKKGEDKSEEKDDKRGDKKDSKKKNLPPWLKGKKKKVIKEEMDLGSEDATDDQESPDNIPEAEQSVTLVEFMEDLRGKDQDLYRRLEEFLNREEVGGEADVEPVNTSTSRYLGK
jgi:hypothetical protein